MIPKNFIREENRKSTPGRIVNDGDASSFPDLSLELTMPAASSHEQFFGANFREPLCHVFLCFENINPDRRSAHPFFPPKFAEVCHVCLFWQLRALKNH